ncbi:MAG: MoaD/ThiS family protein [Pseudomonadota bacterium]|uniref:MoaD/ThiS family protein n=1 Tax=Candidatus Desulfatibia profunda TaxID=2841695 RepID=A0A8J6TI04_9BACT|nr:MoaD/ThiS family protein [Candidatus Desulfatibia profunda]MBL7180501.1 MoaD/ThiS family protein [Desulfobacterales bacterium]MBU0698166.1 MoaD/ThiS family protein [Pseudomonadota bacterium]
MQTFITVKLFATLSNFTPLSAEKYTIAPGTSVRMLLEQLGVAANEVRLIFINGRKGDLASILQGGERVGIFPPVGGG